MNLFELTARIACDTSQYRGAINDAEKQSEQSANKIGGFLSGIGKTAEAAIGAVGAAVGAVSAGVVAVTKQAVDAYADYEQFVGGIETLFKRSTTGVDNEIEAVKGLGKEIIAVSDATEKIASDIVMGNAAEAFRTAGLSANEYMETVTSFSASLISSLNGDTVKAAEAADRAITDMADNANKMGSSMESIQNAYNGFAKQNYTMLDNLKLGYGGTKEEMQRLLEDAGKLANTEFDISSYADIVEAIHVVQKEMGIAGTTAAEAASTISGSAASMSAAWSNLVAGMANENADMGALITDFVDSVTTWADNIAPRITTAMEGVANLVTGLTPIIADLLPKMIEDLLPTLLKAVGSIIQSLAKSLPTLLQVIVDQIPPVLKLIVELLPEMINSIMGIMPDIIDAGMQIIISLIEGIGSALPDLIPKIVEVVSAIVETLTNEENISRIIDGAITIIVTLANGLIDALPKLIEKAPEILESLVTAISKNLPKIFEAGLSILDKLIETFASPEGIELLFKSAFEIISQLVRALVENLPKILEFGIQLIEKMIEGIKQRWESISKIGGEIFDKIKEAIKKKIDEAKTWGKDLIDNFVQGIKDTIGKVKDAVSEAAQKVKEFLGFSEPEKGPLSNFHTFAPDMMKLFAEGIRDNEDLITAQIDKSFDIRHTIVSQAEGGTSEAVSTGVTMNIYAKAQTPAELLRETRSFYQREALLNV